ncbi:MAG: DUF5668 domain-containing protein [Treponema sp.]|jgi:hypothetical protein|nr:DUF5668 domain-containing protein [Treponema sp.]
MHTKLKRSILAQIVFFTGLTLVLVGFAFLLGSEDAVSQQYVLLAFLFMLSGVGVAFFAIKLNKRAVYLFFACLSILVGIFLFLDALSLFPFSFRQAWPLMAVFSGLSLIPAGWRRYSTLNIKFLAPSLAFIALGVCLLIFSFRVVPFKFSQFILNWWPLLILLAGVLLMLLTLGTKHTSEETKP